MTPQPAAGLDPLIHPLPRLRVCAALRQADAVTGHQQMCFAALRETVGLSDSALSKHLATLEKAGYLRRQRDYAAVRAKDVVWVSLTPQGLAAFEAHLRALAQIAGAAAEPIARPLTAPADRAAPPRSHRVADRRSGRC